MKIAIEAQRIFREKKHGMDNAILEIILQLQKLDTENQYYIFVNKGDDRCLQETSNFKIIELNAPFYPLWEQWVLPRAVKKMDVDIIHCTSNTAPLFFPSKMVLTLHDVIFLEQEEEANKSLYQKFGRIYRRWVVPKVLPKCDYVITVSKNEYSNLLSKKLIKENTSSVIYNGYSSCYCHIDEYRHVTTKYTEADKYYLYFGNTDPRKNTRRVIMAFCIYLQKSTCKYPLIITGLSKEYVLTIITELKMTHLCQYFISPGYVPKDDLPFLYNGALAFLCPSLKEGFGIPILESMACGTPVITSNISAMPEVAGGAALLVDPTDCIGIAEAILKLEKDKCLRDTLISRGLDRAAAFSWEKTAKELLKIYKSL